jgi:uncharacterized membrane protein
MWAPYDPVSYFLHAGFGFLAFAGAVTALSVRKGSPLHRKGGWIFVAPMAVAAATALIFELEFDEPRPLAVIKSVATLYLVATSVLSLRNGWRYARIVEKLLFVVPIALSAISATILYRNIQSASLAQIPGPTLYAVVFLSLLVGDLRLMLNRPTDRLHWIKRHLFRMLLAFAFAIRAVFSFVFETGLPFELIVTAPLVLALGATWYFLQTKGGLAERLRSSKVTAAASGRKEASQADGDAV